MLYTLREGSSRSGTCSISFTRTGAATAALATATAVAAPTTPTAATSDPSSTTLSWA